MVKEYLMEEGTMKEKLCINCEHEEKYHTTINFSFHRQYGCHIINCKCKKFAKDKEVGK